jgi:hypothetical protein
MNNLSSFLLFCFFVLFSFNLSAQGIDTTSFSTNRETLLKEIETVLSEFKRDDCEKTLQDLKKSIKQAKFNDKYYDGFLKLTDIMVKRKMKRYNFIQPLLNLLIEFAENTNEADQYFEKWLDLSIEILNGQDVRNTKLFEDYVKWSYEFWINGNLYKISLGSHAWRTDSKNFDIGVQNNELFVKYTDVNLYCINKSDSMTLKNTSFMYYPNRKNGGEFILDKALVDWDQEGARDAKCELKDIVINGRESAYKTDKAKLIYPSLFKVSIEGIFSDCVTRRNEFIKVKDAKGKESETWVTARGLTYPRFASLSRDIKIEDIGEGVDYYGGFRLEGSIVRGYGDENGRSYINIRNRAGKRCVYATAPQFDIIRGERVVSTDALVNLYIPGEDGVDSIFHPNVFMIYNIQERKIEVKRGKSAVAKVPFFNSLQQSEMNVSSINWYIDSLTINIGNGEEEMNLNSNKFFDEEKNTKYVSITTINPLVKFALYSEKLEKSERDRIQGKCKGTNADSWGTTETIEEICIRDPTQCPDWYLEDQERKKNELNQQENPDLTLSDVPVDSTAKQDGPPPFNSKRIYIDELLALLDKRMENLEIKSCAEIDSIVKSKNPNVKIVKSYSDWQDFHKNFPRKYKNGYIEAGNVVSFCNDVLGPQHNRSNGMRLIQDMIGDGFVTFDYKDSYVELREKLFHFKNSVNKKMVNYDYDRIKIISEPQKSNANSNAVLNIAEKSMTTNGVDGFVLSEARKVFAKPHDQRIKMKKNKDVDFDGVLSAGLMQFTGEDFQFKYDSFSVDLDSINYINFFIYEREQYTKEENKEFAGFYKPTRKMNADKMPSEKPMLINNPIYNTSGKLIIDISNNKSGKQKPDPKLPSFQSTDTGFVYYERLNRMNKYQDMIYSRHDFFYKVSPFTIYALDRYEPDVLVFDGSFQSAGIFPIVNEKLRVMYHDLSFGFEAETPQKGYPLYVAKDAKGKGTYTGIFGVSNQGLIGKGKLNFLTSEIESDYIEFLPEQFLAEDVDSFNIYENVVDGIEFPRVYADSVFIDWQPYLDSMFIETDVTKNAPFRFYDKREHKLTGLLHLTKKGLMGYGVFDWEEGMLKSNPTGDLIFGKNTVKSTTSIFEIKKPGEKEPAFRQEDAQIFVDFKNKKAEYKSSKVVMTDMPFNQYKTELDKFIWDIENKVVTIKSSSGSPGKFLALGEGQDSLSFEAAQATYDLQLGSFRVNGVEDIRIADAFIIPKGGIVDVAGAAMMKSFEDARIIADTSNKNHQIVKAKIDVLSKGEYKASGYLEFNIDGLKEQEILFKEIKVLEGITTGNGSVGGQDSFYLDKGSMFKGDIKMSAKSKNLDFDGYAKLKSSVIPYPQWFSVKSRIDKKDVMIDFTVPENPEGEKLYVGLFLGMDSLYLYPRLLSQKLAPNDRPLFTAEGIIKFDDKNRTYLFGDSLKVKNPDSVGNLLTISELDTVVNIVGRFDFGKGLNQSKMPQFNILTAGEMSFTLPSDSIKTNYQFNSAILLDFPLPDVLTNAIFSDLTSSEESIEKIMYTSSVNFNIKSRLANIVRDDKIITKMFEKTEDENIIQAPAELKHTFIFPRLTLKWSDKTQSFVTTGKITLSNMKGKHLGQILKGAIEILPDPARGDVLTFYFSSPNGDWYFFQYTNGILSTVSSNVNYMAALTAIKKKDLKIKTENGESIEIAPGNSAQQSIFKDKIDGAF